jgi:hypothetical protein
MLLHKCCKLSLISTEILARQYFNFNTFTSPSILTGNDVKGKECYKICVQLLHYYELIYYFM